MSALVAQLDKSLDAPLSEGYGTISIRVVVLAKLVGQTAVADDVPVDASPDEALPETDKRPISTFLEEPKRGKQCCVFIINGQRQHAWDNHFIVRDLELKYLRNRMIVVVDCDGLKPEAIADLMQGSRHQFYEGKVYASVESRVVATLKGDPDLRRLQEEAEDDISSLQAGDEAVKAALDQLIEAHHDAATHTHQGNTETGAENRQEGVPGKLTQTEEVVFESERPVGIEGSQPVLSLHPDIAVVRLKPNEGRRLHLRAKPDGTWKNVETMVVSFDPPLKEMQVTRTAQLVGEDIELKFVEPEDFDDDEYPIDSTFRAIAKFKDQPEWRILERRVVVSRRRVVPPNPRPQIVLKDDPTWIKVTSRQPIKVVIGGHDIHVRLRWDGKDELVAGNPPIWTLRASYESASDPQFFLTRPTEGRFELLIQAATSLKPGEQIKFDIEAIGPGKTLTTAFLVDVVEPPSPRKTASKIVGGGQRKPPYDLRYVRKENWEAEETCWGATWTAIEPGSFEEPSAKSPLTIFVNQDMELLANYREALISKKQAETTIQQRINKYTTHVAFHLYQIYEKKRQIQQSSDSLEMPSEEQLRDEIQRVSRTLIKLMEVAG